MGYKKQYAKRKGLRSKARSNVQKGLITRTAKNMNSSMYPSVKRMPIGMSFPDIFKTRVHCQIQASLINAHQYNLLIKGNSTHSVGPGLTYNGFPTVLPSFGTNFYSNLGYLISAPVAAGGGGAGQVASRCPYGRYRILDTYCKVRLTSSNSSNSAGATAVLVPTTNPLGWTTLGQTTLAEQDSAKNVVIPANTTNKSIILKSKASTMKLYGVRYRSQLEDVAYSAQPGYDPDLPWYWMLDIQSYASDINVAYEVVIDVYADIELYDKNIQTSIEYGGSVA